MSDINYENEFNYLHKVVDEDIENGIYDRPICTRFPPEPNGYLHIGSAFAINISYTIAKKYGGLFNLRMDDTNPLKEDMSYVNAIIEDMKWLEFDPKDRVFFGSDYNKKIYQYALELIKKGKAYVCDLSVDEIRDYRGTLTEPGKNSPYRERSTQENLDLFERMREGEFPSGMRTLRAKIDMTSSNINMRDPVIYRIQYATHYRTGNDWCIYPMYDFAHPIQDALEGVTHSLCSSEYIDHRPLYDWVLNELEIIKPPKQREFGRVNITGAVTSKRYLKELVFGNYVDGWDDPRLPTIKGLRRRGFTPTSIKKFLKEMGLPKTVATVDISMLEQCLRDDLKDNVPSAMSILKPLKITITNYPEGQSETITLKNNAENEVLGYREVPFSREIYIEVDDFMENPIKGFKRLYSGNEVRLMGAYFIKCNEVIKDKETGEITELLCTYDPETKSGSGFTGRKVKCTLHWLAAENALNAEVDLYDRLIPNEELLKNKELTWEERINSNSVEILNNCMVEKHLQQALPESRFQFIRHGYFVVDYKKTTKDQLVFNRIVPLKSSWKEE